MTESGDIGLRSGDLERVIWFRTDSHTFRIRQPCAHSSFMIQLECTDLSYVKTAQSRSVCSNGSAPFSHSFLIVFSYQQRARWQIYFEYQQSFLGEFFWICKKGVPHLWVRHPGSGDPENWIWRQKRSIDLQPHPHLLTPSPTFKICAPAAAT